MTDTEIRIAVAEACGWTRLETLEINGEVYGFKHGKPTPYKSLVPDYPNNLDAMHEAEKALPTEKQREYLQYLGLNAYSSWPVCHASARQRCEAFIKTVCPEKWKEDGK